MERAAVGGVLEEEDIFGSVLAWKWKTSIGKGDEGLKKREDEDGIWRVVAVIESERI